MYEERKRREEDFVARNLLRLRAESSYVGGLFCRAASSARHESTTVNTPGTLLSSQYSYHFEV